MKIAYNFSDKSFECIENGKSQAKLPQATAFQYDEQAERLQREQEQAEWQSFR